MPSLLLIAGSLLILMAGCNTKWNSVEIAGRVFFGLLFLLAIRMFGYGCKGTRIFIVGNVDDIVLDEEKIQFRQHFVRWTDIQRLQLFHNARGACISINILTRGRRGRMKWVVIPLWPGVSDSEITKIINVIPENLRNEGTREAIAKPQP